MYLSHLFAGFLLGIGGGGGGGGGGGYQWNSSFKFTMFVFLTLAILYPNDRLSHPRSISKYGGQGPNIGTKCRSHQGKVNLQILNLQHNFMVSYGT